MDRARQAFDRRLNPLSKAPLAVALSGGSDSTALLLLTLEWARRHDRRVLALVVDHQLQPQSAAWTARALALARSQGGEGRALAWTGAKPAVGLPAAARQARHRLLADAAREAGAGVILLGHTLDDLAEASAMRARGSTVGSPAEWSPSPVWPQGRGLFHFRPLLGERREALRDWLRSRGRDWVEDPANHDPKYARARARAALAGGLGTEAPPAEPENLGALASQCQADPWGGLSLPVAALLGASDRAAHRVLQAMLTCASGQAEPPRAARVDGLVARMRQGAVRSVLGGARVEVADGRLSVMREAGERARGGLAEIALRPGAAAVWDGRFELCGETNGTIGPLVGRAASLAPAERRLLKGAPAGARGALPVLIHPGGRVTCPLLAPIPGLDCRALAKDRLRAACGLVEQEG